MNPMLLATLGIPLIKGAVGAIGNIGSKKEIEELEGKEPNIYTPSSIEEYVNSPVSEEFLSQIANQAAQRVGTSVGALTKGGLATMGKIPTLMQNEARQDQSNIAQIAQLEKQAALVGGEYSKRNQDNELLSWQQKMSGSQSKRSDMMKYLMDGVTDMGRSVLASDYAGFFDDNSAGAEPNIYDPTSGGGQYPKRKSAYPVYDGSVPIFDFNN
ncbi:MAG: hypothetical protein Unbinned4388contig1000_21 [Prokaryotic dsDNA virus sp.]|nr:MAG: hypothetical protein Unbinned4388contig1000_21 [Prokaryotic dsDNA virus sp.]|tara:strand:+ start:39447 stop:40085 length:639 start_codon:yes stop_codon:yes gene_type:complete